MKANNTHWNTAKSVGNNGCQGINGSDYFTPTANVSSNNRWYALVVSEAATITAVTLKDGAGNTVSYSPSWLNIEWAAGTYIPFGIYAGVDIYCTSITLSVGKVILYFD